MGVAVAGFIAVGEGLGLEGNVVAVEAAGTEVVNGGGAEVGGEGVDEAAVGEGGGGGELGEVVGDELAGGGVGDVTGVDGQVTGLRRGRCW